MKTNYKTAADMTRGCKTMASIEKRERSNERLYLNGCLTASEYARLAALEMETRIKLEDAST